MAARGWTVALGGLGVAAALGLSLGGSGCDPATFDVGAVDDAADAGVTDTLPADVPPIPGCPPPPGAPPPPWCPPPPTAGDAYGPGDAYAAGDTAAPADDTVDADAPEDTAGPEPDTTAASACPQAEDFGLLGSSAGSAYPAPALAAYCTVSEVVVEANGIPDFYYTQVTPNALAAHSYTWHFPRFPAPAASPSAVPLGGPSAVAVDGLPIFGPTEAPQAGYRDPYLDELLDYCNGHTAPGGVYHFHARPDCLLEGLDGTPYVVVGYAFDGYPILSPYVCDDPACVSVHEVQSGWRQVEAVYGTHITQAWDAHEYVAGQSELDECNGMTLPDGGYAYFATDTFPYFMGCYRGTPTSNLGAGGMGGPGGGGGGGGLPGGAEE